MKKTVWVLGTGGTIAGTADSAADSVGYTAAQLGVAQLLAGVPGLDAILDGRTLATEQVAQVDSKDMGFAIWQQLVDRLVHRLAQPEVAGAVITHGTDTVEETAFFLHSVLPAELLSRKPVVLTCAMRPATALHADGPQNLMDALAVALCAGARGVTVVCAGTAHGAADVRKIHTYRLDAFNSGDAGPVAYLEEGQVRLLRNWPPALVNQALTASILESAVSDWPRVDIVMSYAGCDGRLVDALLDAPAGVPPLKGLVVAGTGNGSLHHDLEASLRRAVQRGVRVVRSSRCEGGRVIAAPHSEFPDSQGLSPVKARIALMLSLLSSGI